MSARTPAEEALATWRRFYKWGRDRGLGATRSESYADRLYAASVERRDEDFKALYAELQDDLASLGGVQQ